MFIRVVNDTAVLVCRGVYKQVPLYMRDGYFYAKYGAGYIRLHVDGSTTSPRVYLDGMTVNSIPCLAADDVGRLCDFGMVPGSKLIADDKRHKLLGKADA
jgi:hypothetical protein